MLRIKFSYNFFCILCNSFICLLLCVFGIPAFVVCSKMFKNLGKYLGFKTFYILYYFITCTFWSILFLACCLYGLYLKTCFVGLTVGLVQKGQRCLRWRNVVFVWRLKQMWSLDVSTRTVRSALMSGKLIPNLSKQWGSSFVEIPVRVQSQLCWPCGRQTICLENWWV